MLKLIKLFFHFFICFLYTSSFAGVEEELKATEQAASVKRQETAAIVSRSVIINCQFGLYGFLTNYKNGEESRYVYLLDTDGLFNKEKAWRAILKPESNGGGIRITWIDKFINHEFVILEKSPLDVAWYSQPNDTKKTEKKICKMTQDSSGVKY